MRHFAHLTGMILVLAILAMMIAAPAVAFENVKRGDKGSTVQELQERLNELGYSVGTADGIFGGKSETAVKSFQQDNGLEATGVVDEATWEALFGVESAGAEATVEQVSGIELPEYEPVADVTSLVELMEPIMKYVDPAADGANGIDGATCVNMYYGTMIMRWYHHYLDAGDQNNLAAVAVTVLREARREIINHAMDDEAVKEYPEMKEKFSAALLAAKLVLDESAAPYLEEMGILSEVNWSDVEVGQVESVIMDGFDEVLNSDTLNQ